MRESDVIAVPRAERLGPGDLSVVICAYSTERWPDLIRSVESVLAQREPVGEVVVVVDHNDTLLERCRRRWPWLRVVASAGAPGLSGARDTGVAVGTRPVVAFLDDDASAADDWSGALMAAYRPGVLGVGGFIEPDWPGGRRPTWWPAAFDWVVGCSYAGLPTSRTPVRNVIGANMSVRRDVLLAVGGFDGRLGRTGNTPAGCEETEMYIRAAEANPGEFVLYEPAARVRHRVGPARATWRYFAARCLGEGRSKAVVTRLTGARAALATERYYVRRTLPRALVAGLVSRDPRSAVAVLIGLVLTTWGYLRERVLGTWTAPASPLSPATGPTPATLPTPATPGPAIHPQDVSVVVCVHDIGRWPLIEDCLASLTRQSMLPRTVIVVVDGSAELAEALRARGGPEQLVVLPRNVGVSAARNAGIDRVRTDWVAFLDDDAAAEPEWLARLAQATRETGAIGTGGWVLPSFEADRPSWLPEELLWTVGCSHRGLPEVRTRVRNVFGGCALLRTDVLRRHRGFEENIGRVGNDAGCGEEAEFCLRVTRDDPTTVFVHEPAAVIRHHVPRSRARVGYILRRCVAEGRAKGQLARRHGMGSLGTEMSFVASVPGGCVRSLRERRPAAAGVLVAAVGAAGLGYLQARLESSLLPRRSTDRS